jgi:hypothetical protein
MLYVIDLSFYGKSGSMRIDKAAREKSRVSAISLTNEEKLIIRNIAIK